MGRASWPAERAVVAALDRRTVAITLAGLVPAARYSRRKTARRRRAAFGLFLSLIIGRAQGYQSESHPDKAEALPLYRDGSRFGSK